MDFISAVKTLPDSGYISSLQPGETWICFCFSRRFNNKRLVAKNISVTDGWSRVLEVSLLLKPLHTANSLLDVLL
jgi:hypothetical protein